MRIEEIDQEAADIDWFAMDDAGHIIHFASAGGTLPESVAASQEALLELHKYFLTVAETAPTGAIRIEIQDTKGADYQSFVRYALRGLFSFDKMLLNDHSDTRYHLVARPLRPLTVAELPTPLVELLSRTRLPGSVAEQTALDVATIA